MQCKCKCRKHLPRVLRTSALLEQKWTKQSMSFARSSFEGCVLACANPPGNECLFMRPPGFANRCLVSLQSCPFLEFLKCLKQSGQGRFARLIAELGIICFTLCSFSSSSHPCMGIHYQFIVSTFSYTAMALPLCIPVFQFQNLS